MQADNHLQTKQKENITIELNWIELRNLSERDLKKKKKKKKKKKNELNKSRIISKQLSS